MNIFLDDTRFVDTDVRKDRPHGNVNAESLYERHLRLAPPDTLKGKTVLDLGCSAGATGYWVLEHGAKSYTGVDAQESYVRIARDNLKGYNAEIVFDDVQDFLENTDQKWDIVIFAGLLWSFFDFPSIIRKLSEVANDYISIDTRSTRNDENHLPRIEVSTSTMLTSEHGSDYVGIGLAINYEALKTYFEINGFESVGLPTYIHNLIGYGEGGHRYITRYVYTGVKKICLIDNFRLDGETKSWEQTTKDLNIHTQKRK